MLVRGDSLEKSMSHYLIEQIAAIENVDVRTSAAGDRRRGRRAPAVAVQIRDQDGERAEDVDAAFVFIGAAPRTDWLEGVVARDERGFILAGADAKAAGLPLEARPVPAGDDRARACSWPVTCARAR